MIKQSNFKQFSLGTVHSFLFTQLNDQTVHFQTIQFSLSTQFFVYTQLNDQTVQFQAIQFSRSTEFSF